MITNVKEINNNNNNNNNDNKSRFLVFHTCSGKFNYYITYLGLLKCLIFYIQHGNLYLLKLGTSQNDPKPAKTSRNQPKRPENKQSNPNKIVKQPETTGKFKNLGNLQFSTSFRFSNFEPKCPNLGILGQEISSG